MKLLIWDFDGTLGYREGGAWTASLFEVLRHELPAHAATFEDLKPYMAWGFRWHMTEMAHVPVAVDDPAAADAWWAELETRFEQAYLGVGVPEADAKRLALRVRPTYLDPTRWRRFDDVVPALDGLAERGWTHVILSNHVPELPDLIRATGLSPHFARVFNSAEMGYEKPHPRVFEQVLESYHGAKACWMVGDSYQADVLGAEAAGIPAVLARRSHPDARFCVATLTQLPALLPE